MTTIIIPKHLAKQGDLVLIPQKEYEELLQSRLRKEAEVALTAAQKRALMRARKHIVQGKFLTPHELRQKLAS